MRPRSNGDEADEASIHIEAPVQTVFDFVKDPAHHDLDPFGSQVDDVKVTKEGADTDELVIVGKS